MPTRSRQRGSRRKAAAPSKPASSPSVNKAMTGWRDCNRRRFQGADGFQQGGDAGAVIARAGPGRHGIQMRHQHDGLAVARHHLRDEVGDVGAGDRGPARLAIAVDAAAVRVTGTPSAASSCACGHERAAFSAEPAGCGRCGPCNARQHGFGARGGKLSRRRVRTARRRPALHMRRQEPDGDRHQSQQPLRMRVIPPAHEADAKRARATGTLCQRPRYF